jgi:6-phosphogluconolactonase (cycloisomerase 2 family)
MKLILTAAAALVLSISCHVASAGDFVNEGGGGDRGELSSSSSSSSITSRGLKRGKTNMMKPRKNTKKMNIQKFSGVYTMSNAEDGNELITFSQDPMTGVLTFETSVSMRGEGAPISTPADPLSSQDSIIVSGDGYCVLGVNSGSSTIATFKIDRKDGFTPTFVGTYFTNGSFPNSLTELNGLVYVLNAGGDGSISGYKLNPRTCKLKSISESTVALSQDTGLGPNDRPDFLW